MAHPPAVRDGTTNGEYSGWRAATLLESCDPHAGGRIAPKRSAKQYGMNGTTGNPGTVTQTRARRRNSAGDRPTRRRNRLLKLPSDVNPTSKQISVTGRPERA